MELNPLKYFTGYKISIINQFAPPPYGGGNQFLLALNKWVKKAGYDIGPNKIGINTKFVLFNSFNFDMNWLSKKLKKKKYSTVHRVDGPIALYRGENIDLDKRIVDFNRSYADYTIFQSNYSYNEHVNLGFLFDDNKIKIIPNAPDPDIFNSENRKEISKQTKIKIIATSWSSNIRKGQKTYEWIDKNLNFKKYDFTFVGNINAKFENIKIISPKKSEDLASILRDHDIFLTASQNDPCSNAVLEALACGLPVVYFNSGGHPEIVRQAGYSFSKNEEIIDLIKKVVHNYNDLQNKIIVPDIQNVANQYLELFRCD